MMILPMETSFELKLKNHTPKSDETVRLFVLLIDLCLIDSRIGSTYNILSKSLGFMNV